MKFAKPRLCRPPLRGGDGWAFADTQCRPTARRNAGGFTLAEVLAAMLLLAIVVPAAIVALHIASTAGTVAARKAEAARLAERILDENVITASGSQSGTVVTDGAEYRWTLRSDNWPVDAMQLLTVEVSYSAQERPCVVRLSTLVNRQ